MNTLSLENINKHAPYGVRHRENRTASGMTKEKRGRADNRFAPVKPMLSGGDGLYSVI